jgi:hypothetical protein
MKLVTTALYVIVLGALLGFDRPASAATQRECRAACAPYIPELCAGLRPRKVLKCRGIVERRCRRLGVLNTCAPLPVSTTTTTSLPAYPTTSTTLPISLPQAPTCGGQQLLYASDGTYLGCLTCSTYSSDSIFNSYGTYGSPYSIQSINDQYAPYGSPYSPTSACNPYTVSAPSIVDEAGCYYGRLTVNPYVPDSVCAILGNPTLCDDLHALCTN